MKLITSLILFVLFSNHVFSQNYSIKGTSKGFDDNTWIFLSDLSDGSYKKVDSATIVNKHFTFSKELPHKIFHAAIHSKNYEDRVRLWIDKTPILITIEKGKFNTAIIEGSKTQKIEQIFIKSIENNENPKSQTIRFVQTNPSSILSAYHLSTIKNSISKDSLINLYNPLSQDVKRSIYGINLENFIALKKDITVGSKFVDFEQKNLSNKIIKLSDYKGKVVLLDFWGSWCAPCREGHAVQIEIYNKFKDKGFDILGVAAETKKEQFEKAIKMDKLPWENVSDFKGDQNIAAITYGVNAYPTNFLIDKNGIIIAMNLNGQELYKKLYEILK